MLVAKRFTNSSKEDFTWNWDTTPYTIKAGESKIFPDYLAEHLAKHFIDRELDKMKKNTNSLKDREVLERICLSDKLAEAKDAESLQVEILNYQEVIKPENKIKGKELFEGLK